MISNIGLESLLQRGRSPLFKELTDVYQEAFDALQDSPEASRQFIYDTLIKIHFPTKIKSAIFPYIGFILESVDIDKYQSPNMSFTILLKNKFFNKKNKKSISIGMISEKIEQYYDNKTFVLKDSEDYSGIITRLKISASLFMIRNEDRTFLFTADELAAITLHELGHFDNFVRTEFKIRKTIQDAHDIVEYINITPDIEVIRSIIKYLKNSNNLDKSWKGVLRVTEEYFNKSNSIDDPYFYEALGTLTTVISTEVGLKINPYLDNVFNSTEDRMITKISGLDKERSADEFSARNGAYLSLIKGLGKLEILYIHDKFLTYRTFTHINPSRFFSILELFKLTFDLSLEDVTEKYDPLIKRMELIVETAKHAFKSEELDSSEINDIKQQIKESEEYIRHYNSANHRQIRKTLFDWKENISKLGRIIISPFHDRLSSDYGRLQDATRTLTRHNLYYLSKK
mgnify:CR=1 FL=1